MDTLDVYPGGGASARNKRNKSRAEHIFNPW